VKFGSSGGVERIWSPKIRMNGLAKSVSQPAATVRDSYIGVWNYFHGHRHFTSECTYHHRRGLCKAPVARPQSRAFSRSSTLQSAGEPASDPSASTQSTSNSTTSGGKDTKPAKNFRAPRYTQRGKVIPVPSNIPKSILNKLKIYEEQRSGAQSPSKQVKDWYTLRQLARGDALDDGQLSEEIEIYGFITSQRGNKAKGISFYQLVDPHMRLTLQLIASDHETRDGSEGAPVSTDQEKGAQSIAAKGSSKKGTKTRLDSLDLRPHTPVLVKGRLACRPVDKSAKDARVAPHWLQGVNYGKYDEFGNYDGVAHRLDPYVGEVHSLTQIEMHVSDIIPLNEFPEGLIAKADTNFPPEQRHLQMRTNAELRHTLRTRSLIMARSRKFLFKQGFDEVETPLLFKSTPEGAREFIVPTRKPGTAYALPQSPQQYKQLLMASGISRYFQFAKCFRDEDMRTDRQPEFTQLDLEMSFASRSDIMSTIEYLIAAIIWPAAARGDVYAYKHKYFEPFYEWIPPNTRRVFPILTYQQAMKSYGSDKPDLRFTSQIKQVDNLVPSSLKSMLTSLEDPTFEMMKLPINGTSSESNKFIGKFLDAASSAVYINNPAGAPGIAIYDPTKPLNGLASFGHNAAEQVEEIFRPEIGNILIMQARPKTLSFTGGSTPLGNMRRDLFSAAVAEDLIEKPKADSFTWITNFPLFTPTEESEPGQGGAAGISSTHHPFTAPIHGQDLTNLYTNPLGLIGDHYDLVINGVEVGGGSVRVHDADIQELIFRDVLKMRPERIEDFRHLLDALAAGCPPHAGFALGFDRLMAVLLGKESVKDVIAFPKTAAGEDKMVGSPARMTEEQLRTYHLAVRESGKVEENETLSLKA
jgi:aspartyl-tRNA synthetase